MPRIGEEAPNFDLTSTEDVLLMLRDEVTRTAVVLYLVTDPTTEAARADLRALAARGESFALLRAKALVVSPAPIAQLKKIQVEEKLPFPLLHDDRGFSARYDVSSPAEGAPASSPALFVVARDQRIAWAEQPVGSVAAVMPQVEACLAATASPTAGYPGQVINRIVRWWVKRRAPVAG